MSEAPVRHGQATSRHATFVALKWMEYRIQRFSSVGELLRALPPEAGVYAIEGSRDGQPAAGVLYVSESDGRGGEVAFPERVQSSLRRVLRTSNFNDEPMPWSDLWDLVLRCATLDAEWVSPVETLLSCAHRLPLNVPCVFGAAPSAHDLVVLNVGMKGRLIPTIAGHYLDGDCWRGDEAPARKTSIPNSPLVSGSEGGETLPLEAALDAFRRKYILDAVERCGGNRTHAARVLGVDPRTVFRYLEAEGKDAGRP